jgi:molecular chaperone GrpE
MTKKEIPIDEPENDTIPVRDKRRFGPDGARTTENDIPRTEAATPAAEAALEEKLKAETERREAAEIKLVGVQQKFDEAKAAMERETSEMRERLKKTLESQAKQGQFNFLTALLPVLDNLHRAIEASEKDPSLEHLREGVIGTARSFEKALSSVGVEPLESVGAKFDPELHEAVEMVPSESENDGLVITEYSRGYRFGDKLLRPARVQVGRAMADSAGE